MTVKKRPFLIQTNQSLAVFAFFILGIFLLPAQLSAQVSENCSNGMDDDGDGLIDCFDPDCTCTGQCDNFYYQNCDADCFYIPPCGQVSLGIQWVGQAETGTYSTLVAGDMDKDGIPDIVTYRVESPDIYIIDGATGATKVHITSPTNLPGGTAPAIADLDHDGYGEIVIVGEDRRLRCYEHTGAQKFASILPVGYGTRYRFSVPNIADFDNNGWAEINIGNQIYSGQTGFLLASGGSNNSAGEHPARVANNFSFNSPVAIDALPDSFCPDCAGLEIVAGNQVFSVNLTTGSIKSIVKAPSGYSDGFTSVADIDGDGDLDAVVQGRKNGWNTVYAWDIQTPTILREFALFNNWQEGASRVNIADLDADGKVEFSFVTFPLLYALDNDFSLMWTQQPNDASAITCSSVFDFCGDGSADVVYRGPAFLQILDGATGAVTWQDNCVSLTHIENPLVLDVDNDGETEIVIECGTNGSENFGTVVAYEVVGAPGIESRKVWNQHGYFNTNINDDLSVPRYQQNPQLTGDKQLNTFMNQYYHPTFPAPNGVLSVEGVTCVGDSLDINLKVCNPGAKVLPAQTPIAVYRGNPQNTAAQWISGLALNAPLQAGLCDNLHFKIPRIAFDSVFLVINDDHSKAPPFNLADDFPVTSLGECKFTDNIAGLYFKYAPDLLNLGPDSALCDHTSLTVQFGTNDIVNWQWQDNFSQTTRVLSQPGIYIASTTDLCGVTRTDSVRISIDSSTVVSIGPDQVICAGETVALSENGFDFYKWGPAAALNCNNCASVTAAPSATALITLEAGFANGCVNRDTMLLIVHDTFNYKIDTTVCYGRTVAWNGETIFPDDSRTFHLQTQYGCDSVVQVRVHGTPSGTYNLQVDTAVCLGKQLTYNGFNFNPGDQKVFFLQSHTGCDSTVQLNVAPKDTFFTQETRVLCAGETISIFGQIQNASGIFIKKFTAKNGCDSTHTVELTVLPGVQLTSLGTPACFGEANGSVEVSVAGTSAPYSYHWMPGAYAEAEVDNLPAGNYQVTVTDANDCTQTSAAAVDEYPQIAFTSTVDSVRCFGLSDGAINIQSADTTLMYSIDGQNFVQKPVWQNMPAGDYTLYAQDPFGCVDTLDLEIGQPPLLTLDLPADITLTLGDSILIDIKTQGLPDVLFTWKNSDYLSCLNCLNPVSKPLADILYNLTVTDENGCEASDSMRITVKRLAEVFVPNVFAPETEGPNRLFYPGLGLSIRRIKMFRVYDRWGSLVHQVENAAPDEKSQAWYGRIGSRDAAPGVYLWLLEVELGDGTSARFQGDVTLVR